MKKITHLFIILVLGLMLASAISAAADTNPPTFGFIAYSQAPPPNTYLNTVASAQVFDDVAVDTVILHYDYG
ncbi:MAG TPA: hypothetical protein VJG30_00130, partial [Candidatus Nanoarchaeia archaeon]|nr:hypothetical protein [Candidatus Nanoarchaeia archaeon]